MIMSEEEKKIEFVPLYNVTPVTDNTPINNIPIAEPKINVDSPHHSSNHPAGGAEPKVLHPKNPFDYIIVAIFVIGVISLGAIYILKDTTLTCEGTNVTCQACPAVNVTIPQCPSCNVTCSECFYDCPDCNCPDQNIKVYNNNTYLCEVPLNITFYHMINGTLVTNTSTAYVGKATYSIENIINGTNNTYQVIIK
jgi:hypothetical protein